MNVLKSFLQVLVTVVLTMVVSIYLLNVYPFSKDDASNEQLTHQPSLNSNTDAVKLLSSKVSEVVKNSSPSVVRLLSKETKGDTTQNSFFGSGFIFIYQNHYYILTNEHVIHDIKNLTVLDKNEKEIPVKLVGKDFDYDVAVLQILDNKNYPHLKLGNSEVLNIGDFVIAIGHPLGLDYSSTFGIVSSLERKVSMSGKSYEHFIQTDAAINPGNSGGPLLNLNSEVVGINTAVMEESQGLGFSISINHVKSLLNPLITKGKVERPFIGVYLKENKENVAILDILDGSPAKASGLKKGDIILKVDNLIVASPNDFVNYIKTKSVGDEVSLEISRGKDKIIIHVIIGERKEVLKNN